MPGKKPYSYISMPNSIGIFGVPQCNTHIDKENATIIIKSNNEQFIIFLDIESMIQLKNNLIEANDLYHKNFLK